MKHGNRDTISLEDGVVSSVDLFPGEQCVVRLSAPAVARRALPGSFVHMQCDPNLPMRRPMSIMRASPTQGWIDILFKIHGLGTDMLARQSVGQSLSILGPIGVPFKLSDYRRRPLLIGGGVGIPPMVYLAEHLKNSAEETSPLILAGSEVPFPFTPRPSQILVAGIPDEVIASMPLLEDWGLATRLASSQGFPGCYDGHVTELAKAWLESGEVELDEVEIFACGPTPMLRAVQRLAAEFQLPAQISLEEYMACAVGGCAGCTVKVTQPEGFAMKRVCVDGPVFDSSSVVFD